ncbi:15434_t:CDS:1 [Dentiscutata erythropus]|uniref:15434_t:CDS:1 n=1 Tax=Dentiscutata erythropus TaxID=1348616 RepID=A0A9N9NTV8_9GLOM|nr:15434_t:CDS:1 [Dentiscutata erythropus]
MSNLSFSKDSSFNSFTDFGETIITVNDIVKYSLEKKCDISTIFINPNIEYLPTLSVQELVETSVKNNRMKNANKTCNAFFIFRTEFSNEAKKLGYNSGQISVHASICWKRFPEQIKDIYKNLSKEVNIAFKQRVPVGFVEFQKTKKRRRNRDVISHELTSSHILIGGENIQQEHSMNLNHLDITNLHLPLDDPYYQELKLTYEAIINSIPDFNNSQRSTDIEPHHIDSIFNSQQSDQSHHNAIINLTPDFDDMQLSTEITSQSNPFHHNVYHFSI